VAKEWHGENEIRQAVAISESENEKRKWRQYEMAIEEMKTMKMAKA
jgi:hypothetical protein